MSGVLTHRLEGEGPPVLFLNGGLMSMSAWDAVARPLERAYRVLRCDLRGQLLSPGTPPHTMEGHAAEVAALLGHLGLPPVHVVGTSYGAFVGMILAAREPRRVCSLSVVTATDALDAGMRASVQALRRACQQAVRAGDGGRVFDVLVPSTFSPGWREANGEALAQRRGQVAALPVAWFQALDGLLAALERLDLRDDLPRIRCRTLVVAAGEDATFPLPCSRAIAAAVAGARLEVVAGSGHALVVEQPERLLALVRAFLDDPQPLEAAS
ncbi:MAG TPA: alpha/beta hydrolase [Vicinamibacteria bacterium]|nr:alpha/beta hydrolase [Vicinamibacteria bacterium]